MTAPTGPRIRRPWAVPAQAIEYTESARLSALPNVIALADTQGARDRAPRVW